MLATAPRAASASSSADPRASSVPRSALIQQLRDAVRDQEVVVDVLRQVRPLTAGVATASGVTAPASATRVDQLWRGPHSGCRE